MDLAACWWFEESCLIDWAAWVQAIGSIIAIIAAICISKREYHNGILLAENICIDKMKVSFEVVSIALDAINGIYASITPLNSNYSLLNSDGITDLISQLEKAPIYEFNDANFSTRLIKIIRNLKLIRHKIDEINNVKEFEINFVNDIKQSIEFIRTLHKEMRHAFDK